MMVCFTLTHIGGGLGFDVMAAQSCVLLFAVSGCVQGGVGRRTAAETAQPAATVSTLRTCAANSSSSTVALQHLHSSGRRCLGWSSWQRLPTEQS
jgi:hypothetical protein